MNNGPLIKIIFNVHDVKYDYAWNAIPVDLKATPKDSNEKGGMEYLPA